MRYAIASLALRPCSCICTPLLVGPQPTWTHPPTLMPISPPPTCPHWHACTHSPLPLLPSCPFCPLKLACALTFPCPCSVLARPLHCYPCIKWYQKIKFLQEDHRYHMVQRSGEIVLSTCYLTFESFSSPLSSQSPLCRWTQQLQ